METERAEGSIEMESRGRGIEFGLHRDRQATGGIEAEGKRD